MKMVKNTVDLMGMGLLLEITEDCMNYRLMDLMALARIAQFRLVIPLSQSLLGKDFRMKS